MYVHLHLHSSGFFSYTGLFFANRTNGSGLYQAVLKYTLYRVILYYINNLTGLVLYVFKIGNGKTTGPEMDLNNITI